MFCPLIHSLISFITGPGWCHVAGDAHSRAYGHSPCRAHHFARRSGYFCIRRPRLASGNFGSRLQFRICTRLCALCVPTSPIHVPLYFFSRICHYQMELRISHHHSLLRTFLQATQPFIHRCLPLEILRNFCSFLSFMVGLPYSLSIHCINDSSRLYFQVYYYNSNGQLQQLQQVQVPQYTGAYMTTNGQMAFPAGNWTGLGAVDVRQPMDHPHVLLERVIACSSSLYLV